MPWLKNGAAKLRETAGREDLYDKYNQPEEKAGKTLIEVKR